MKESEEPGLLERIQTAVQPLTADGKFQLDRIEYGSMYGDVDVNLYSKDLDITFHTMLHASGEVHCFFRVKSEKKVFSAKHLFPALKLSIPLKKGELIRDRDYELIKNSVENHQKIISMLLETKGFLPELNRLCIEIKEKFPEIDAAFNPRNINKTIKLYSIEFRKTETYGRIF